MEEDRGRRMEKLKLSTNRTNRVSLFCFFWCKNRGEREREGEREKKKIRSLTVNVTRDTKFNFRGSLRFWRVARERERGEREDRLADSIAKVPRHFFYGPLPGVRQFRWYGASRQYAYPTEKKN